MRILRGHHGAVRCLDYAPDSTRLATGGDDKEVRLWDLASGESLTVLAQRSSIETLAFAPDRPMLAAGTGSGDLVLWDLPEGRNGKAVQAHLRGVRCVRYARDGRRLATCGWDQSAKVWDPLSLKVRREIGGGPAPTTALAFLPNGTTLALGDCSNTVRLHDADTGKLRAALRGPAPVLTLACSPDGRLLAAGDGSGTITLWEVGQDQPLHTLQGHTWAIYGLAFTPDGRTLVSGSADGTVRLWDVAGGWERSVFRWHTRWVTAVAVAPDGMTAAAGSEDGTAVVWDLADME